jgi:tetratricopeptide (TPR) repeat protein
MARNVADQVGPCPESAYARAQLGYMLAVVGLHDVAERDLRQATAMAEESGGLLSIVSSNVLLGMFYSMTGRARYALGPMRRAESTMLQLNGGLWRHRPKVQLGEALLCLARYPEAQRAFSEGAALAALRQGRAREALALLEGRNDLPQLRKHPVALSLFLGLGVYAETLLRLGEDARALEAVAEAEKPFASGKTLDDFFAGTFAHASLAEVYLQLCERQAAGDPGPVPLDRATLRARTGAVCKRLRKLSGMYPGLRPLYEVASGRMQWLEGRELLARRAWRRAVEWATEMGTAYELGLAHYELGRHATGSERVMALNTSLQVFDRAGLVWEAERSRSALHT